MKRSRGIVVDLMHVYQGRECVGEREDRKQLLWVRGRIENNFWHL